MKHLVEFPLRVGGTILIEVDESTPAGVVSVGRPDGMPEKAKKTFEDALAILKPAAQELIDKLHDLHTQPDEVSLEFGIKLNASAGAFIASAGAEANYKVTLKWTNNKSGSS